MLIAGERHLASVLNEYIAHDVADTTSIRVLRRPVLCGLMNEYPQAA